MGEQKTGSFLVAKLQQDGSVLIRPILLECKESAETIEVVLSTGEFFGGRSYDEWFSVATGLGSVMADWLNV